MTQEESDEKFMRMALAEAREAMERDEVPIGAVIVSPRGMVIGRGHNLTEALADVSAHAEMQAITAAAQMLGGKYLQNCTLLHSGALPDVCGHHRMGADRPCGLRGGG